MVDDWLNFARFGAYAPVCALCGAKSGSRISLCSGCLDDLPYLTTACVQCAEPMPRSGVCGQCQRRSPSFDGTIGVFQYADPIAWLIHGLKFSGKLEHARLLGELMSSVLAKRPLTERPDVLVPVPLNRQRLRQRGYNQALELARPIARCLDIPIDYRCCERYLVTAEQSSLAAADRRRNVRGAFRLRRSLEAQHVALIDDVMTTGSTVNELARLLRNVGVGQVQVWVCARASVSH